MKLKSGKPFLLARDFQQNTAEWGFAAISRATWCIGGRNYATKQLEVFTVKEDGEWIVITVLVKLF